MAMVKQARTAIRKLLLGDTVLPQEFFLGLPDPQPEIAVWLHGMGTPVDVTLRHSMACAAPFTVCIAFDPGEKPSNEELKRLSLKFCTRGDCEQVLGEIGLKFVTHISAPGLELILFEARSSTNYCLPKARLWAHYLFHAYTERQKVDTSGMKMSFLERRAAMVMFIRPHPVALVSVADEAGGNIFPMNIMGDLGNGYFAFALKGSRCAAHLVERTGRLALSSVPMPHAPLAYQLAINHTKQFIEWDQLPFSTKTSAAFNIPVPVFTQRVREMEVRKVHNIGSHIFFLARIIRDEVFSKSQRLCVIHGFYQAWRLRGRSAELEASRVEDLLHRRGF